MTIEQAIQKLDEQTHNTYTREQKIAWLSELDGMVHTLLLGNSGGFSGYADQTPTHVRLLVSAPFDQIYLYWLEAKVHYLQAEYERYNNANALFQQAWQRYADHCLRSGQVPEGDRQFY